MDTDPVLSLATSFKIATRAAARARKTGDQPLAAQKEAEMLALYNQIEVAVPSSLKGVAIKISTSANLAEAAGDPVAEWMQQIARRMCRGRLRSFDIENLKFLAGYLRGDDTHYSAATLVETALAGLTQPRLV